MTQHVLRSCPQRLPLVKSWVIRILYGSRCFGDILESCVPVNSRLGQLIIMNFNWGLIAGSNVWDSSSRCITLSDERLRVTIVYSYYSCLGLGPAHAVANTSVGTLYGAMTTLEVIVIAPCNSTLLDSNGRH